MKINMNTYSMYTVIWKYCVMFATAAVDGGHWPFRACAACWPACGPWASWERWWPRRSRPGRPRWPGRGGGRGHAGAWSRWHHFPLSRQNFKYTRRSLLKKLWKVRSNAMTITKKTSKKHILPIPQSILQNRLFILLPKLYLIFMSMTFPFRPYHP